LISIAPKKNYLNLYFMNGVDLTDPEHLLQGAGTRLRQVKIRKSDELNNKAFHALIGSATI
jgi:hypothetical protein